MEQITGRIVRNAEVRKTKDSREFVTFTVAVNDRYKPKGKEEVKETRYFNCSYWLSTKVKEILRQGTIVFPVRESEPQRLQRYRGEYHANLTFHCNHIEVIAAAKRNEPAAIENRPALNPAPETVDDLPF